MLIIAFIIIFFITIYATFGRVYLSSGDSLSPKAKMYCKIIQINLIVTMCLILCFILFLISIRNASHVDTSLMSMSNQEIAAFNSQFELYEGNVNSSKLSALIKKAIYNTDIYTEEPSKIPSFTYNNKLIAEYSKYSKSEYENYNNTLNDLLSTIKDQKISVSFIYNSYGLIDTICLESIEKEEN